LAISLRVYDVGGRLVKTLVDDRRDPGRYKVTWDGKDNEGREVLSGVYFYRLSAGNQGRLSETRKLVVLK